jgi:hypothetical protein
MAFLFVAVVAFVAPVETGFKPVSTMTIIIIIPSHQQSQSLPALGRIIHKPFYQSAIQ